MHCAHQELGAFAEPSGVCVYFCARCRGVFCEARDVAPLLGGPLAWDSNRLELASPSARCPSGDGGALSQSRVGPEGCVLRCTLCQGVFIEAGVLPVLRRMARGSSPARVEDPMPASTRLSQPALALAGSMQAPLAALGSSGGALSGAEPTLVGSRLEASDPRVELLAIPAALLCAWLMTATQLGRLLAIAAQIQFHELGHAVPAWLSSRAALPLPFGFTFFREEPSAFTGICVAFLCGVVIYRGEVEKRRAARVAGSAVLAAFLFMSLFISTQTSRMCVLAGGFVGELLLPVLALIAFHLRLPDRLRWDFFRFLVLPAAALGFVGALRLWLGIASGRQGLPMGSFLPGDGNGDLERLIAEYGFSPASLTRLGTTSLWLGMLLLAAYHAWLVIRAFHVRSAEPNRAS